MDSQIDSRCEWLSALLEPVSVDEFLSRFWLKQHLLGRGPAERFSGLLSWSVLNEILEHHWRETYRFRLAKQGRDLEPASYVDSEGLTARVRSRDLTDHLRGGATLSFHAIDELHQPLTRLAESFETFFRSGTNINVYAGWRALHGLDLHRDEQEVFVLQLDGRKRWLLYGFSVDRVNQGEPGNSSAPPAGALFDEVLRPGDVLYIPTGCYHVAMPMNEPTLHLTVSVKNGSSLKARPSFSLPWSATPERLPPGSDFLVRLTSPSAIVMNGNSHHGSLEIRLRGHTYRFPRGMRWIVEPLIDEAPLSLARLTEAVAGRLDEEAVRLLVAMLVKEGLASVREG